MTFRVTIKGEDVNDARTTDNFDEAMDWITNGVEQVVDPQTPLHQASLEIDGVVWVMANEGGLVPNGGEAKPRLRAVG